MLTRCKVDAVVTDIRMPGVDGMALLRWMQSDYLGHAVPIVLTGAPDSATRVYCQYAGLRCLEKPINPDTLVYVLDEAVEMAVEQYAQHDLLSVWLGEGVARDRRPRIPFVDDDPQVLAG
ncbi:MAG: response regulator, partial [Rhodospirillaceae bacterium]